MMERTMTKLHRSVAVMYKPFYIDKGVRLFTLNTRFGETHVKPNQYILRVGYRLFIATDASIFLDRYEEVTE